VGRWSGGACGPSAGSHRLRGRGFEQLLRATALAVFYPILL